MIQTKVPCWILLAALCTSAEAKLKPTSDPFRVSDCTNCDLEFSVHLAGNADGVSYALWSTTLPSISFAAFGRAFYAEGQPQRVLRFGDDSRQTDSRDVGVDDQGRFSVLYLHPGQIWLQRFTASGNAIGAPARVNPTPTSSDDDRAQLGVDADGYAAVAFFANNAGQPPSIYARVLNPQNDLVGNAVRLSDTTPVAPVGGTHVAALADQQTFYVLWETQADSAAPTDQPAPRGLSMRRLSRTGAVIGPEIVVLPPSGAVYTRNPNLVGDPQGEFVLVSWETAAAPAVSGLDVVAQKFDAQGQSLGAPFRLNKRTGGDQRAPRIAFTPSDEMVAVWESDQSGSATVMARRVRRNGKFRGKEQPLSDPVELLDAPFAILSPQVAVVGTIGKFIVVWRQDGLLFGRRASGAR